MSVRNPYVISDYSYNCYILTGIRNKPRVIDLFGRSAIFSTLPASALSGKSFCLALGLAANLVTVFVLDLIALVFPVVLPCFSRRTIMVDNTFGIQVCIEEMQKTLERVLASMDTIKNTARSTLSSASIILALVSALQILSPRIQAPWVPVYGIGLAIIAIAYVILVALCVYVLAPVSMIGPVSPEWSALKEAFTDKDQQEIMLLRLGGLINAIDQNKPIVKHYSRLSIIASALLPALVGFLLLLALVPRV